MSATTQKAKQFRYWWNNEASEERTLSFEEAAKKFRASQFNNHYKEGYPFDRAALLFLCSKEEEGGLLATLERNDTQPTLNRLYEEVARLEALEDERTIEVNNAGSAYSSWCFAFRKINGHSPSTTLNQFATMFDKQKSITIGAITIKLKQ